MRVLNTADTSDTNNACAGCEMQALAALLLQHLSRPNETVLLEKLAAHIAGQDSLASGYGLLSPSPRVGLNAR